MTLTAAVLFPGIGDGTILGVLAGGSIGAVAVWLLAGGLRRRPASLPPAADAALRAGWRMPPLAELPPRRLTIGERTWLVVLRAYLLLAAGLVLARIVSLAPTGHD